MNPVIDTALCSRCGLCAEDCMRHLIDPATLAIGDIPCAACGHCVAICPTAAISLEGGDSALTTISAPNSYENLVLMRRSVRHYQAAELSREHIKRMLELARFAPTGTNTEAVTVTVLATRNRVAAAAAIALRHYQGMARLLNPVTVFLARPFLGKGLASKVLGYKKHLVQASASGKDPFAHGAPALFFFHAPHSSTPAEDAAIWAHTACLHAETLGIGTCYNGFLTRAVAGSRLLREFIGLPKGHRVYACFTAGYPAEKYQRSAPRKPVSATILE